ncbi:MAG: hypothetical protein EBX68_03565, partial [Betaproteobacteria bacterium]|nr:hypothetical protein [Betaproteobacteria bacterium]
MKVVATSRLAQGSSASRRLRRAGKVPGIIYGSPGSPAAIEVEHNQPVEIGIRNAAHRPAGEHRMGAIS